MTKKTHMAAAVLASGAACSLIRNTDGSILYEFVTLAVSAYSALLPDFDTVNSAISHSAFGLLFLPVWIFHGIVSLMSSLLPQSKLLRELATGSGHRSFSHYPITWIILFAVTWLVLNPIEASARIPHALIHAIRLGAVCGVASHIVTDAFFGGVALLYPFSRRRVKFTPFRTGGVVEYLFFVVFILGDVALLHKFFG